MAQYDGHRSWNAWNVSLYINREGHYWLRALELNGIFDKKARTLKALWALPQD
jgi:hypothetical protein